jgi:hypothetical protein
MFDTLRFALLLVAIGLVVYLVVSGTRRYLQAFNVARQRDEGGRFIVTCVLAFAAGIVGYLVLFIPSKGFISVTDVVFAAGAGGTFALGAVVAQEITIGKSQKAIADTFERVSLDASPQVRGLCAWCGREVVGTALTVAAHVNLNATVGVGPPQGHSCGSCGVLSCLQCKKRALIGVSFLKGYEDASCTKCSAGLPHILVVT